jgi:hypothetical protein
MCRGSRDIGPETGWAVGATGSARCIDSPHRASERAAFKAYQIGGFALAGAADAIPDGDDDFGEKVSLVRQIINASPLPVLSMPMMVTATLKA